MRMPTVTTLRDPSCVNVSQDTPGMGNSALVSLLYQESTQQKMYDVISQTVRTFL